MGIQYKDCNSLHYFIQILSASSVGALARIKPKLRQSCAPIAGKLLWLQVVASAVNKVNIIDHIIK